MSPRCDIPQRGGLPPQVADHIVLCRIGRGSYGEVWLARNVLGFYRAVKVVYRRDFRSDAPFEREFNGILKYEPISRAHSGHVDILQVGRDQAAGCFYYVMELADDVSGQRPLASAPAEEHDAPAPAWIDTYKPRTLNAERERKGRLPARECIDLGIALANALDHLHCHGLVHRDIKPANVIFVSGQPELADIGLVTDREDAGAQLGTDGFIPIDGAGSPSGDVFALGKVLFELSTGLDRKRFPELPAEVGKWSDRKEFLALNAIIVRACAAQAKDRYSGAAEMLADLTALKEGTIAGCVPVHPARRRWIRALGTVAAAIGLVVSGGAIWHYLRPHPELAQLERRLSEPFRQISPEEVAAGYKSLFDGESLREWREEITGDKSGPSHWVAQNGEIIRQPQARSSWSRLIYSGALPENFEFRFEWKIAAGAQGGVFYLPGLFKYQISDGQSQVGQRTNQRPGSLFAFAGPTNDLALPAGQWNQGRIVRRGAVIEHWLNGQLAAVVDFNEDTLRAPFIEKEARYYLKRNGDSPASRRPQIRLYECGAPIGFRRLLIRSLDTDEERLKPPK